MNAGGNCSQFLIGGHQSDPRTRTERVRDERMARCSSVGGYCLGLWLGKRGRWGALGTVLSSPWPLLSRLSLLLRDRRKGVTSFRRHAE
jgi:hypothetical protein